MCMCLPQTVILLPWTPTEERTTPVSWSFVAVLIQCNNGSLIVLALLKNWRVLCLCVHFSTVALCCSSCFLYYFGYSLKFAVRVCDSKPLYECCEEICLFVALCTICLLSFTIGILLLAALFCIAAKLCYCCVDRRSWLIMPTQIESIAAICVVLQPTVSPLHRSLHLLAMLFIWMLQNFVWTCRLVRYASSFMQF